MSEAAVAEKRVFYSRSGHLSIQVNPGQHMVQGGQLSTERVGQKIVAFGPMGDGFGQYVTNDPEVIAYLEGHPDVFGPAEYTRQTTPPNIQIEQLRRELEQRNRLIEKLQAEGKLPSPAIPTKEATSPPFKPPLTAPASR